MDRRNLFELLKPKLVADTADIEAIKKFGLPHVTTNPSLLKSFSGAYNDVVLQKGKEILEHITGNLHVQLDPRFAFDTDASIAQARSWSQFFQGRAFIKIPATPEGIQAMEVLEQEGIACNMTLIFTLEQALLSNKASYLAPYIGRVADYYGDPLKGVAFVHEIKKKCSNQIMGASFRSVDQILASSCCDFLTVSPKLLLSMQNVEDQSCDKQKEGIDLFIADVLEMEKYERPL